MFVAFPYGNDRFFRGAEWFFGKAGFHVTYVVYVTWVYNEDFGILRFVILLDVCIFTL